MKSPIAQTIWTIATLGSLILISFAGYMLVHTTGREQSGWDMAFFLAAAVMLILFDINDPKGSWLPKVVAVLCILLALVFGAYYFGGDAALRALLIW